MVHRGVYAVGHRVLSADSHAMAAVLLGGRGAVLSHRSAAELWGLRPAATAAFHVTTTRRCIRRPRVEFHRGDVPEDERTLVRGIPVTTVPRTLLDMASMAGRHELERGFNEAEVRRLTDPLSVEDLMARHPRRRGASTLRDIIADGRIGEGITRSRLEERFLPFLERAGIERPALNVVIPAGDELMEVDCLWRTQRLIVELDSHATHATRAGFERDRVKDRLLLAHGWRVVRITWRELHLRPARLAADLKSLLREVA